MNDDPNPNRMRRRICQAGLVLGATALLPACGGSANGNDSKTGEGGTCGDDTIAVGCNDRYRYRVAHHENRVRTWRIDSNDRWGVNDDRGSL